MYQDLYDRANRIIKKDTCMKFYDASMSLYLETDASVVGLGAGLLQVSDGMNCGHYKVQEKATMCSLGFANKTH